MKNIINLSLIGLFSMGIFSCNYFIADKKTQAIENCVRTCEIKYPCVKRKDGTLVCPVEQDKCKSGCMTTQGPVGTSTASP